MIALAISIMWLVIYAIILAGVVWLVLFGINKFIVPIPTRVEQAIWFIVLLLVIIAFLTLLAGGDIGGIRLHR
jgi:bacteriorhodopsin